MFPWIPSSLPKSLPYYEFPDISIEFHAAHGYSNLARHLGLHHTRYISPEGSTTKDGTDVEIDAVVDRVRR